MAIGFSKNEANKIAIEGRKCGISYQKFYDCKYQWWKISIAMSKVGDSFENVCKTINNLANALTMSLQEAICSVVTE